MCNILIDSKLQANQTNFSIVNFLPSYSQKRLHNFKSLIPSPPHYRDLFHRRDISTLHPLARICPSYWWECPWQSDFSKLKKQFNEDGSPRLEDGVAEVGETITENES